MTMESSTAAFNEGGEGPDGNNSGSESNAEDVDVNKTFTDAHRYKYNTRPSTSSTPGSLSQLTSNSSSEGSEDTPPCTLITFSTTQILEDRFSLDWYGIHPGELLELHPFSQSFVSLTRSSLDAYIAPYFAARVWALRVTGNTLDFTLRDLTATRDPADDEIADASPRSSFLREKGKKKVSLEWKERWAVIHHGIFSLCKERHDAHPGFSAPLSSVLSIKDGSHIDLPLRTSRRTRSLPVQQVALSSESDVVCVKFVDAAPVQRERAMSNESLPIPLDGQFSEMSSPTHNAWWKRGSRDAAGSLSTSLASSASALIGSPGGAGLADMWDSFTRRGSRSGLDDSDGEMEDAVWVVLDMLTSTTCSHILRVLHRHASPMCESSFLPSHPPRSAPSPIIFSSHTSSPTSPLSTPGPSSSYTFPPISSPASASPISTPLPFSITSQDSYPFPQTPPPLTRPTTPIRRPQPQLRIDTHAAEHGVPYPEWRLSLVRKARRAGLGAVGRAMELVMFGDEDEEDIDDEDELAIEWARRLSAVDSPVELPIRSSPRPRPGRHVSDSAVMYINSPAQAGEFDAPQVHPRPRSTEDSDSSEAEWEGWIDVAIAEQRREHLERRRAVERTDTLETAIPDDLYWETEWNGRRSLSVTGTSSPAASSPEREWTDPIASAHARDRSGSEAEMDTASVYSNELPRPRPTSYYGHRPPFAPGSSRGRRSHRVPSGENGGRTLSSYSSADSLLKRTMRTAIGSSARAKRASSSSSENIQAAIEVPPRCASESPPLSRPSIASMRSAGSSRSRPQSPLCSQVGDAEDYIAAPRPRARHPIPLPGMPMVPSGYTTFRHSSLYGRTSRAVSTRGSGEAEEEREEPLAHAGLTYGQSMQRLPVPMSMMMTTVSSTVSVGSGRSKSTSRWAD
ncbi:hypothetical protein C8Q79DRAFT_342317 [Trametes meyenii]|nr:hypothetical protein C8Q79DRAFT_342317 [Trametes meyenii]